MMPVMRTWADVDDVPSTVHAGIEMIGVAVRKQRLRVGLTQRQLAWKAGLAQSTISRLETGQLRGMRLLTLALILGILGGGAGYAFGPPPPAPRRRLPGQPVDVSTRGDREAA